MARARDSTSAAEVVFVFLSRRRQPFDMTAIVKVPCSLWTRRTDGWETFHAAAGGHTPIFNCVVTFNAGRRDEVLGRLLLDCGANPNARASIRKRLAFARDSSVHEYRNVTPLGWGRAFHEQSYVASAAMSLISERGGTE